MAAIVVAILAALVLLKPQEFVGALHGLPLLHVVFGLAALCAVADALRGRLRLSLAPQLPFLAGFLAWTLLVTALQRPEALAETAGSFAILAALVAAVAVGASSVGGLIPWAIAMVACAALVTTVAIDQSQRPFVCCLAAQEDWEGRGELQADERPCVTAADCQADAPIKGGNYRCERAGMLSTATLGGRVRYRGSLSDPNELSLLIVSALPIAGALFAAPHRKRKLDERPTKPRPALLPPLLDDRLLGWLARVARGIPPAAYFVAVAVTVVLTQSRTGLLVLLSVAAIQALRWSGGWGIVLGCLFAPPLILLGGRSGAEADDSSDERAEILREGFELLRRSKGLGLGVGGFSDASAIDMTAHNAYVLAAVEAGVVGLFLFGFALYLSVKVPVAVWLAGPRSPEGRIAPALALSLVGLALGVAFLSWTYKDVLFLEMGASAALYSAVRARIPTFRVGLSLREALGVAVGLVGVLAIFYLAARIHR